MSSPWSPDDAASSPLAIHLDPVGGIAGDMFVAAMIDALPALQAPVLHALAAVRPQAAAMPEFAVTASAGMHARKFQLTTSTSGYRVATPATDGTSYVELRRMITAAPLDAGTREHA